MDEATKRRVGEQVEPGDRRKAPGRLALLQRFVNTWNHDLPADWDRLADGARAARWLRAAGFTVRGKKLSDAQAARLRDFRESMRGLIRAAGKRYSRDDGRHRQCSVSATGSLRIRVDDQGQTVLEAGSPGIGGIVAELLAIVHDAQQAGHWDRMKVCRRCEYAFFDRSKNRSATWCAMAICGNRSKNQAYRRRQRNGPHANDAPRKERVSNR